MEIEGAPTEEEVASRFEDLTVDDDLPILERVIRYCHSQVALQRLVHVKMLSETAELSGQEATQKELIPAMKPLLKDAETVIRQHVAAQLLPLCIVCMIDIPTINNNNNNKTATTTTTSQQSEPKQGDDDDDPIPPHHRRNAIKVKDIIDDPILLHKHYIRRRRREGHHRHPPPPPPDSTNSTTTFINHDYYIDEGYHVVLNTMISYLNILVSDPELDVRRSAADSLTGLALQLRPEDVPKYCLPIPLRLAMVTPNNPTGALPPPGAGAGGGQVQQQQQPPSQNPTGKGKRSEADQQMEEIRVTAANLLAEMGGATSEHKPLRSNAIWVSTQILPTILELCNDTGFRVRRSAIQALPRILGSCTIHDAQYKILPAFEQLSKDELHRVRKSAGECLVDMSRALMILASSSSSSSSNNNNNNQEDDDSDSEDDHDDNDDDHDDIRHSLMTKMSNNNNTNVGTLNEEQYTLYNLRRIVLLPIADRLIQDPHKMVRQGMMQFLGPFIASFYPFQYSPLHDVLLGQTESDGSNHLGIVAQFFPHATSMVSRLNSSHNAIITAPTPVHSTIESLYPKKTTDIQRLYDSLPTFIHASRMSSLSLYAVTSHRHIYPPQQYDIHAIAETLLDYFAALAVVSTGDINTDAEMRVYCAYSFPAIVLLMGKENWEGSIKTCFNTLLNPNYGKEVAAAQAAQAQAANSGDGGNNNNAASNENDPAAAAAGGGGGGSAEADGTDPNAANEGGAGADGASGGNPAASTTATPNTAPQQQQQPQPPLPVKRCLASSLHTVASVLGPELATSDILPIVQEYFIRDNDDSVRSNMIRNFPTLLNLLPIHERNEPFILWSSVIRNEVLDIKNKRSVTNPLVLNWRQRDYLARSVPDLIMLIQPPSLVHEHIWPIIKTLILDQINIVQEDILWSIPILLKTYCPTNNSNNNTNKSSSRSCSSSSSTNSAGNFDSKQACIEIIDWLKETILKIPPSSGSSSQQQQQRDHQFLHRRGGSNISSTSSHNNNNNKHSTGVNNFNERQLYCRICAATGLALRFSEEINAQDIEKMKDPVSVLSDKVKSFFSTSNNTIGGSATKTGGGGTTTSGWGVGGDDNTSTSTNVVTNNSAMGCGPYQRLTQAEQKHIRTLLLDELLPPALDMKEDHISNVRITLLKALLLMPTDIVRSTERVRIVLKDLVEESETWESFGNGEESTFPHINAAIVKGMVVPNSTTNAADTKDNNNNNNNKNAQQQQQPSPIRRTDDDPSAVDGNTGSRKQQSGSGGSKGPVDVDITPQSSKDEDDDDAAGGGGGGGGGAAGGGGGGGDDDDEESSSATEEDDDEDEEVAAATAAATAARRKSSSSATAAPSSPTKSSGGSSHARRGSAGDNSRKAPTAPSRNPPPSQQPAAIDEDDEEPVIHEGNAWGVGGGGGGVRDTVAATSPRRSSKSTVVRGQKRTTSKGDFAPTTARKPPAAAAAAPATATSSDDEYTGPLETVTFFDGPIGMQLEPTRLDRACRVFGFLDTSHDKPSPARSSGKIRIGDVIVKVNGRYVKSYDDTISILKAGGKREISFRPGTEDDEDDNYSDDDDDVDNAAAGGGGGGGDDYDDDASNDDGKADGTTSKRASRKKKDDNASVEATAAAVAKKASTSSSSASKLAKKAKKVKKDEKAKKEKDDGTGGGGTTTTTTSKSTKDKKAKKKKKEKD